MWYLRLIVVLGTVAAASALIGSDGTMSNTVLTHPTQITSGSCSDIGEPIVMAQECESAAATLGLSNSYGGDEMVAWEMSMSDRPPYCTFALEVPNPATPEIPPTNYYLFLATGASSAPCTSVYTCLCMTYAPPYPPDAAPLPPPPSLPSPPMQPPLPPSPPPAQSATGTHFKVHVAMWSWLPELISQIDSNSSSLENGWYTPEHAPMGGAVMDLWNALRDSLGFHYTIDSISVDQRDAWEFWLRSHNDEPNAVVVSYDWLTEARAAEFKHSVDFNTRKLPMTGARLMSWPAERNFRERAFAFLEPLSVSTWVLVSCFAAATMLLVLWFESGDKDMRWTFVYESFLALSQANSISSSKSYTILVGSIVSFFSMVFVAVYTANMASFMLKPGAELYRGFNSMPDDAVVCVPQRFTDRGGDYAINGLQERFLNGRRTVTIPGAGVWDNNVTYAKERGCTATLSWLPLARQWIADDPTCEVYIGLEGRAANAYPSTFFYSDPTSQGVIQSIDSAITNWKLNGVLDELQDRHFERRHVCPDIRFKQFDAVDISGLVVLVLPCYFVAMVLKVRKDGLIAGKRVATPATTIVAPCTAGSEGS